jgi:hypothetical protein
LVVFGPQDLVALREVFTFLHLEALKGGNQLRRIRPALEPGLLDAELERVHGLIVRLHEAIGQRA